MAFMPFSHGGKIKPCTHLKLHPELKEINTSIIKKSEETTPDRVIKISLDILSY
jgi:hypothetical protein